MDYGGLIKILCPVRCWSCGKPVAHLWQKYRERTAKGEDPGKVMTELGLERYCCRAVFMGNVELLQEISQFKRD